MAWKELGVAAAEFVGGLGLLRLGLPGENYLVGAAGLALTLVGLAGLTRRLSTPAPRPYRPSGP